MSRRKLLAGSIFLLALVGDYALRGMWLASRTGGHYLPSTMLADAVVLFLVLCGLKGLDVGVAWATRRITMRRPRVERWAVGATRIAVCAGVSLPLLLALSHFCPQRISSLRRPTDLGMRYEEVAFASDGILLSAWHMPADDANRPAVLIAHGLGVNKGNFLHVARLVHELGLHSLLFDFRAHGDSGGRVTTFGLAESADVRAGYEWLARRHPGQPIYALGYSMGGAAVVRAAAEGAAFDRIVLDSTFASCETAARGSFLRPFGPLAGPAWQLGRAWGWALSGRDLGEHRPIDVVPSVCGRPLLLIHGLSDTLIVHDETLRLQVAAGSSAQLWLVEGAGHIQAVVSRPEYRDRLGEFLECEQVGGGGGAAR